MNRFIKFAVPALALGMFAFVPSTQVRADDPPAATQPAVTGSITIKVVDPTGAAVSGATVNILPPMARGQRGGGAGGAGGAGAARPTPVATGTTDDTGTVTIKDIPVGKYTAAVRVQGTGNGRANIEVVEKPAADAAPITIKLAAAKARNGAGNGGAGNGGAGNGGAGNGN